MSYGFDRIRGKCVICGKGARGTLIVSIPISLPPGRGSYLPTPHMEIPCCHKCSENVGYTYGFLERMVITSPDTPTYLYKDIILWEADQRRNEWFEVFKLELE